MSEGSDGGHDSRWTREAIARNRRSDDMSSQSELTKSITLVPARAEPARARQRRGGGPAAGAGRGGRAAVPQRAGGAGPRPVRRRPVRRRGGQLPAHRGGQPHRRLRPVRAGPGAGPHRRPRTRRPSTWPWPPPCGPTCATTPRPCAASVRHSALGTGSGRNPPIDREQGPGHGGPSVGSAPARTRQGQRRAALQGLRRGPAGPGRRRLPGRQGRPRRGRGAGPGGGPRHAAGLRHQQRLALPVGHRGPDQRPGRGRGRQRRGDLGPGRGAAAGRPAAGRVAGPGGRRHRAAHRAAGAAACGRCRWPPSARWRWSRATRRTSATAC